MSGPRDDARRRAAPAHRPRRRFGQNFLHDPAVIERIVAAVDPRPGQRIVEIGPGLGALTGPLLERAGRVDAIEIDRDLAARLERAFAGRGGLTLHRADALEVDLARLAGGEAVRVVGNLPYNVSTPLLFHLLEQRSAIADIHVMLQREVVERMAARPGGRTYGRLSVAVQRLCTVETVLRIGPGAFRPAPRVDSAFVRLRPRSEPAVPVRDEGRFEWLVRTLFAKRRKQVRAILRGHLDEAGIEAAGVDPRARPETLSLPALAALERALD